LLAREAAKEPQLHDASLPSVQPGKFLERIIESDEIDVLGREFCDLVEFEFVAASPFAGAVSTRIVH
jgi:hypothetical protein